MSVTGRRQIHCLCKLNAMSEYMEYRVLLWITSCAERMAEREVLHCLVGVVNKRAPVSVCW
jgi:hypothetical protein